MIFFDGFIDSVSSDGRIFGWACRPGYVARLHVGVFHHGTLLAEVVAQDYRADLLAAGYGLGHCAFKGRMQKPLKPGTHTLDVALLNVEARVQSFVITKRENAGPREIEEHSTAHWTDEEILANLPSFQLAAQFAALGADRFADAVFQLVLGRWPEAEMIEAVRRAHAGGVFDPDGFMREAMMSDERRSRMVEPIPGPFDYRFPFKYPLPCAI